MNGQLHARPGEESRRQRHRASREQSRSRCRVGTVAPGHPPSRPGPGQRARCCLGVRIERQRPGAVGGARTTITTGLDDNRDGVVNDRAHRRGPQHGAWSPTWTTSLNIDRTVRHWWCARRSGWRRQRPRRSSWLRSGRPRPAGRRTTRSTSRRELRRRTRRPKEAPVLATTAAAATRKRTSAPRYTIGAVCPRRQRPQSRELQRIQRQ